MSAFKKKSTSDSRTETFDGTSSPGMLRKKFARTLASGPHNVVDSQSTTVKTKKSKVFNFKKSKSEIVDTSTGGGGAMSRQTHHSATLSTSTPLSKQSEDICLVTLPRRPKSAGKGHDFEKTQLLGFNLTWCDKCGDFLWGVYIQCMRCTNCRYTCHMKCQHFVTVDCPKPVKVKMRANGGKESPPSISPAATLHVSQNVGAHVTPSGGTHEVKFFSQHSQYSTLPAQLSNDELKRRLSLFNTNKYGPTLTLTDDERFVFEGFLRVNMRLSRPIILTDGHRPLSIYDALSYTTYETNTGGEKHAKTSFYLPKDTEKAIHVHSTHTSLSVITSLLKKFCVVDNPRKYSLFDHYRKGVNEELIVRKLGDSDCPLYLTLIWGSTCDQHQLVLKENETGDIQWETFSIPELHNFLKILDIEEEEQITRIRDTYQSYQSRIQESLMERMSGSEV